ncbi:MAG: hypothetical protein JRN26_04720 [Nitrososphaerota archaeon]|jgi:hypothetical protein|nr:hypothetical protein [Nitrososphaerota archaeon]MDG6927838.1 hypothetical protein [Nitrososphaerota archaeon]MDG6931266.1 hypothetical protein [Nitrososphaerota archaeon]MDG6932133.1 hypothetical protein [Nitrososphaerota archaeon]MDG6936168.1 hypothetical protein [Nitrososphaerota archaeon]
MTEFRTKGNGEKRKVYPVKIQPYEKDKPHKKEPTSEDDKPWALEALEEIKEAKESGKIDEPGWDYWNDVFYGYPIDDKKQDEEDPEGTASAYFEDGSYIYWDGNKWIAIGKINEDLSYYLGSA